MSAQVDTIGGPLPPSDFDEAARRDPVRFVAAVTLGSSLASWIIASPHLPPEVLVHQPGLDRAIEICCDMIDWLRANGHDDQADGILRTLPVLRVAAGRHP